MAVCDLYDGHFRRAQEIQPNTPLRVTTVRWSPKRHRRRNRGHFRPLACARSHRRHEAGKDVYCENPCAHHPGALEMVRTARKRPRYSVGSQSLSMESTQKGKQWFDAGEIGHVFMVQCSIYRPNAIGAWRYPVPPDASPQTVDWERFLGSALSAPLTRGVSSSFVTGGLRHRYRW